MFTITKFQASQVSPTGDAPATSKHYEASYKLTVGGRSYSVVTQIPCWAAQDRSLLNLIETFEGALRMQGLFGSKLPDVVLLPAPDVKVRDLTRAIMQSD